ILSLLNASRTTFLLTPSAAESSSSFGRGSPGLNDFFFKYSLNLSSTTSAIEPVDIGLRSLLKSFLAIPANLMFFVDMYHKKRQIEYTISNVKYSAAKKYAELAV